MRRFVSLLSLLLLIAIHESFAWGKVGHHIVADIAYKNLSDNTRLQVLKYLDGMSFEDAGTWMDDMRSNSAYDFMKTWHYLNLEKGNEFIVSEEENVVNEIISHQKELSQYATLSPEKVKIDIEVLFHLIGDLHQPLHDGYGSDRGGNSIQVQFMDEGTNLHAVWDSKIIEQQHIALEDCLQWVNGLSAEQINDIKKGDVISWMLQSRGKLDSVYAFTGHKLDQAYAQRNKPLIERQLLFAGLRLAAVLEQIFGHDTSRASLPNIPAATTVNKKDTINVEDAVNHVGETMTVYGQVFGGKWLENSNGKPTLINMGAAYPNNVFTVVIYGEDRSHFSYAPEDFLNNKAIWVTGLIKLFKGKPEVIVTTESQIKIK